MVNGEPGDVSPRFLLKPSSLNQTHRAHSATERHSLSAAAALRDTKRFKTKIAAADGWSVWFGRAPRLDSLTCNERCG